MTSVNLTPPPSSMLDNTMTLLLEHLRLFDQWTLLGSFEELRESYSISKSEHSWWWQCDSVKRGFQGKWVNTNFISPFHVGKFQMLCYICCNEVNGNSTAMNIYRCILTATVTATYKARKKFYKLIIYNRIHQTWSSTKPVTFTVKMLGLRKPAGFSSFWD